MPDRFTADENPNLPTELDAPRPGETVGSALHRNAIKAILNLARWIQNRINAQGKFDADTLDGLDSNQFWKKTDTLPIPAFPDYVSRAGTAGYADSAGYASSAGDADTVDGYHASQLGGGGGTNPPANATITVQNTVNVINITGGGAVTLFEINDPAGLNRNVRLLSFNLTVSNLQASGMTSSGVVEVRALSVMQMPPSGGTSLELTAGQYTGTGGSFAGSGLNYNLAKPATFVVYYNADASAKLDSGTFNLSATVEFYS